MLRPCLPAAHSTAVLAALESRSEAAHSRPYDYPSGRNPIYWRFGALFAVQRGIVGNGVKMETLDEEVPKLRSAIHNFVVGESSFTASAFLQSKPADRQPSRNDSALQSCARSV